VNSATQPRTSSCSRDRSRRLPDRAQGLDRRGRGRRLAANRGLRRQRRDPLRAFGQHVGLRRLRRAKTSAPGRRSRPEGHLPTPPGPAGSSLCGRFRVWVEAVTDGRNDSWMSTGARSRRPDPARERDQNRTSAPVLLPRRGSRMPSMHAGACLDAARRSRDGRRTTRTRSSMPAGNENPVRPDASRS